MEPSDAAEDRTVVVDREVRRDEVTVVAVQAPRPPRSSERRAAPEGATSSEGHAAPEQPASIESSGSSGQAGSTEPPAGSPSAEPPGPSAPPAAVERSGGAHRPVASGSSAALDAPQPPGSADTSDQAEVERLRRLVAELMDRVQRLEQQAQRSEQPQRSEQAQRPGDLTSPVGIASPFRGPPASPARSRPPGVPLVPPRPAAPSRRDDRASGRPGGATPAAPSSGPALPPLAPRPAPRPRPGQGKQAAVQDRATPAAKPAASGKGGDDLEAGYAEVLAAVLGVPKVALTSNFFDDLGADSLVMARFCAKVRARPSLPNVAIKDIYKAPTIKQLAAVGAVAAAREPASAVDTVTIQLAVLRKSDVTAVENDPAMAPVGTASYLLCGALQLLVLFGYPGLIAFAFAIGFEWLLAGVTDVEIYLRAVAFTGGMFLGTALLPIVAKWLLVGRWKPDQFPVYGVRYFRFWLVKFLTRANPLVRFVGTPLYSVYLRMLGARIGAGAMILSPTVPVCTDLVTVGAGAVVRKASSFTGYRAQAGMIQTGPVSIGADALVGEATVLDVFTGVGDGAQLGHTSSLHAGQSVPDGQRWHGNPAEPTSVDYRAVPPAPGGALRRLGYSVVQLIMLFVVALPLGTAGIVLLIRDVPAVQQLFVTLDAAAETLPHLVDAVILASLVLFGGTAIGLLVMTTVPRLLSRIVRPDKPHRTYGIAYWALRTTSRLTNNPFLLRITGDSSYVVRYLKMLGYTFDRVEQTGSNFGVVVTHDSPFLCSVGSGTVVADGLSFVNVDHSKGAFAVGRTTIGAHSFLGNGIFYPARSRVGDDCLLATKVMVPVDGPVRHGVGLLGSPSFPIPRSTDRDNRLAVTPEQRRAGVVAKDRHNLVTILLLLLSRWVYLVLVILLARLALDIYPVFGPATIAVLGVIEVVCSVAYFVALDTSVRWLAALRPRGVSIYDPVFWAHERYWKVPAEAFVQRLNGTPFKAGVWRMLGAKVGRRLFDDGLGLTERTFVTIGDHCTANERSLIQCHSQENDAFKSDHVVIGDGVTLGVSAFVHYGTKVGDGVVIEADSFVMKGEEPQPYTRWGGNPAAELGDAPQLPIASRRKKS